MKCVPNDLVIIILFKWLFLNDNLKLDVNLKNIFLDADSHHFYFSIFSQLLLSQNKHSKNVNFNKIISRSVALNIIIVLHKIILKQ